MRWLLLLACTIACNSIYGLDGTRPGEPDRDDDGILVGDNCPTVANHEQEDRDGDDVGDVCDPCPDGAQRYEDLDRDGVDDGCDPCARGPGEHDEDNDGLLDACDNCPGTPNADQLNGDVDDLGNECDLAPGAQRRVEFEGFATPSVKWIPVTEDWTVANDTIGPVSIPPTGGPNEGLWNRSDVLTGTWTIEATIEIPPTVPTNFAVGIAARERSLLALTRTSCMLQFDGTNWSLFMFLILGGPRVAVSPPSNPIRFRLRALPANRYECEANGVPLSTQESNPPPSFTATAFTVGALVRVQYIDVANGS